MVCLGTSAYRPCSTCLSVFNLQSDCLRFFSPSHPPLVDSLDSKLWYRSGCRAAVLASAVGQTFRQLFTTRSCSKGDQQPDGRVAHNSEAFSTILGVDIRILATCVRRARKTRK